MRVSEIRVKQIRVNQGLGVQINKGKGWKKEKINDENHSQISAFLNSGNCKDG